MGKLNDKIALVTGGGRGIGQAICQTFAREGARLVVADIDAETAQQTAQSLPTEAIALEMDVSSKCAVEAGFARALGHCGHLDILVNNAGYLTYSSFAECSEELWDRIIDINLKGCFLCSQAALLHMQERGKGNIISMSSLAAKTGGIAAGPPYAAAKAGIYALTINLARTGAPLGIRANAIAPGVIDTIMTQGAAHKDLTSAIPLGVKGQPEDIANCALFLASDDSRHITGELIDVNGGLLMD
tara:strand:+ start:476 stop:1207 length:732 start_codon:yes stop_codon:yes gene_type:complete